MTTPPLLPLPSSPIYQEMFWCSDCGGEQIFFPIYEFEAGRVGCCLGCGEEKVRWFTRTTAEGE